MDRDYYELVPMMEDAEHPCCGCSFNGVNCDCPEEDLGECIPDKIWVPKQATEDED